MARLVLKFGGTSVADTDLMRKAAAIAVRAANQGNEVAVVVSAMGHTTDHLIGLAEGVSGSSNLREMDALLATGEQASCALMSMAIQALGKSARSFTGIQAGVITDNTFSSARILTVNPRALEESFIRKEIPVIAGFQGVTEANEITTLGRGGSDTTAVALAAAVKADRCDIYTDVGGVYTADPRTNAEARRYPFVSYDEMIELARAGAQVLALRSVELAKEKQVVVRVRSTFEPEDEGTLVGSLVAFRANAVGGVAGTIGAAVSAERF